MLCDAALIYYASFYFEVFPNERRDSLFPSETKRRSFAFCFIVQGLETAMRSWLLIWHSRQKKDFGLPTSTQTVWWLSSKWNENKKSHYTEYFPNYPRHETSQLFKDQCAVFHTDFTSSGDGKDLNNVNCLQHSCCLYSIPPKDMLQWIKRKDT